MSTHFHFLPDQVQEELKCIAEALLTPGKGILTADESTSTIGKRLQEQGMNNDEDTRRRWRLLLFSTAQIEEYISGVVLIDETLQQKDDGGKLLVDYLKERCILPGIKVDSGLIPLPGSENEVFTQGMDNLTTRLADYKQKGCEFARWRCVFRIGSNTPSHRAIISNADELARFASICQSQRILPLIEPEVVPEGNHDIRRCEQATETVLSFVLRALNEHQVFLEGTILKPNMVTPGLSQSQQSHPDMVAEATVIALQRTVPPAIPGIAFSSGGQTEEEATNNLHAIVCALGKKPWYLTFAFGRALQASAMRVWKGNKSNVANAQAEFLKRVELNGNATCGLPDDVKSDSDVFSPTRSTPTAITSRKQFDTIVSSPTPPTSWSEFAKTETPAAFTPTTAHPEPTTVKTKKGLFSFLKKEDNAESDSSTTCPPCPPHTKQKRASIERDNEGDIIEPVAYMTREEEMTTAEVDSATPSISTPKSTRSSPRSARSSPRSTESSPVFEDSPTSGRHSPSYDRTPSKRRTPSVGISNRVAPTHNPDPDTDTLGHGLELSKEWKTTQWNKSIIAYESCFLGNELGVPREFGLRILNDFRSLKEIRISDSVRLPLELTLPSDSKTSIESTIVEKVAVASNRSEVSDQ